MNRGPRFKIQISRTLNSHERLHPAELLCHRRNSTPQSCVPLLHQLPIPGEDKLRGFCCARFIHKIFRDPILSNIYLSFATSPRLVQMFKSLSGTRSAVLSARRATTTPAKTLVCRNRPIDGHGTDCLRIRYPGWRLYKSAKLPLCPKVGFQLELLLRP